jgi:16S rRNA (guanine966-N2)-methyltransferase
MKAGRNEPADATDLPKIKTTAEAKARRAEPPHRIRIIGGRYRRTPIAVADRAQLRPTPDRVRETLFNWLAHLYHDPERLQGLDLFAGTGALGFELASRGARRVVLVERDPALVRRLLELRARLAATEIEVVRGDAIELCAGWAPASFDLVFVDPPYREPLLWPALSAARRLLAPAGSVYAESGVPLGEADLLKLGLKVVRAGRAGRVHFYLLGLQLS